MFSSEMEGCNKSHFIVNFSSVSKRGQNVRHGRTSEDGGTLQEFAKLLHMMTNRDDNTEPMENTREAVRI